MIRDTKLAGFSISKRSSDASQIVGTDLAELNPIVAPTYRSTLVAVRILHEMWTGLAIRKTGIMEPCYHDQRWMDSDQAAELPENCAS